MVAYQDKGEKEMKVLTSFGTIYDVEVLDNGGWKFIWTDVDGEPQDVTYGKESVERNLKGYGAWTVIEEVKQPNYAAAFNMWMSDFMSDPQAYEDSHASAVRHLKEKLNGEEPSYGAVCQEILIKYLEKV